jgi:hypothetical protein
MIKLLNRAVLLLVLCAATSVTVSANTITRKVTFKRDVTVNGTAVKAGTYKAVFDDKTGELSIIKGTATVAKAPARIEKLKRLAEDSYSFRSDDNALTSVAFKGGNLAVIQGGGESAGERAQ